MQRRRLLAAIALSLALHALLLLWLLRARPESAKVAPIELTLIEPPPPVPAPPRPAVPVVVPPPPPVPTPKTVHGPKHSNPGGQAVAKTEPGAAGHGEPSAGAAPIAKDAPREVELPRGYDASVHVPGGQTILNHGPESAEQRAEREKAAQAEAESKVREWAQAELGRARVRDGALEPYFVALKHALEDNAQHAPPFSTTSVVSEFVNNWKETAEQYGKTAELKWEPEDPQMRALYRRLDPPLIPGSNTERIALGLAQFHLVKQELSGRAGMEMVAILELRQAPDGKVLEVKLQRTSGSKTFDAYALQTLPEAVAKLPPPSDDVRASHPHGMRTVWAYKGEISYLKNVKKFGAKDLPYLASMGLLSALGGSFDETTGKVEIADVREPRYLCKVQLLGLY
jgi:hypothetical protein